MPRAQSFAALPRRLVCLLFAVGVKVRLLRPNTTFKANNSSVASEKDFLAAVDKVIKGNLKFNSTATYVGRISVLLDLISLTFNRCNTTRRWDRFLDLFSTSDAFAWSPVMWKAVSEAQRTLYSQYHTGQSIREDGKSKSSQWSSRVHRSEF